MNLSGAATVITGAARGLPLLAFAFAARGARLALTAATEPSLALVRPDCSARAAARGYGLDLRVTAPAAPCCARSRPTSAPSTRWRATLPPALLAGC